MSAKNELVLAVLGAGLVDPRTPVARADDAGLTRGDGCFEGCRLVVDPDGVGRIDKLDAHLARLTRSAAALEIPFDEATWRSLIELAVQAWTGPAEAAVKVLLARGPAATGVASGFVWIAPLPAAHLRVRREGLRVATLERGMPSDAFATAPWLLGGVKTLSYAINMAAGRAATRLGVDEVLFLSTDAKVLEAPTGSVVWSTGRALHTTPTGATGILAGTTQQLLFDRAAATGWEVHQTLATVDELHAADAIWVVSSVRGPVDVVELDGTARARLPEVDGEIRRLSGFPCA